MKKKIAAVFTAVCLLLPFGASPTWAATEGRDVYFTVEALTLGQGIIQEPYHAVVQEGTTIADLTERVLDGRTRVDTSSSWSGYYLQSVNVGAEPSGWTSDWVPQQILAAIDKSQESSSSLNKVNCTWERDEAEWLGEFDYTNKSGWVYTRNNAGIPVGADQIKLEQGDVVRLQYTIYGYGADVMASNFEEAEAALIDFANKDQLVVAMADYAGDKSDSTYQNAFGVLNDWDALQSSVDQAVGELWKGAEEEVTPGDVNMDGVMDIRDVRMTVEYISGNKELDDTQKKAADANQDENIDIKDARFILTCIMG